MATEVSLEHGYRLSSPPTPLHFCFPLWLLQSAFLAVVTACLLRNPVLAINPHFLRRYLFHPQPLN